MTPDEARAQLLSALHSCRIAAQLFEIEKDLFEAYLEESRLMNSVGPIFDPSLFNKVERKTCDEALVPLFEAALQFRDLHKRAREIFRAAGEDV